MQTDPPHGSVLVLAEDEERGEWLGRWVASTGERPIVVSGAEKLHIREGDDDSVDLVVTDLDTNDPMVRELIERLLSNEVFAGVPQLHLFRDSDYRRSLQEKGLGAALLSLSSPPEASEFQARVRLGAEIGRLRREVAGRSIQDPLTGLHNRRFVLHRLEQEFARAQRYRTPLSLVALDIDQLKRVNDALGQSSGDSVIQQFAQVLRAQVRKEDVCGRLTGATFAVIMPGNRYRGAATFANKIRNDTEGIVLHDAETTYPIRVSAGIASYPDNATVRTSDDLLRTSENALSEAKSRGGNRVFIDEDVLRHERKVVLVADPDPTLLELAEDLLSLDDLRVVKADSARTLLETLRFRRPDLLIVDVQMADTEGGRPLIAQIQELFPGREFPIIGLARDAGVNLEQLARLGVDRFFTKPFSVSLLRAAARDLLDDRPST